MARYLLFGSGRCYISLESTPINRRGFEASATSTRQDGNNSEGNCCLFSANGTPDYSDAESETVTHHTFQGDRMY